MTTTAPITQGTLCTATGLTLPLRQTDVIGKVRGPLARVEVRQRFENTTAETLEATYSFPLPPDAAVHRMQFRIGDRTVAATIKEKEEARKAFERARQQGRGATLLEEDRPSLFALSVTNVPSGASIEVTLEYDALLALDDGDYRFLFPMVAPERYREPTPKDGVLVGIDDGDVPPPRIPTGERSADVTLTLEVAGPVEMLRCASHLVELESMHGDGQRVTLARVDALANRDFVLTFRAAEEGVRPTLFFDREGSGEGTFLLALTPPRDGVAPEKKGGASEMSAMKCGNCGGVITDAGCVREIPGFGPAVPCGYCGAVLAPTAARFALASQPRDVTVLVDRSRSMQSAMPQVRRAVRALLGGLAAGDAVQVVAFDHERKAFDGDGATFVAVSAEVTAKADSFLRSLTPRGGTELTRALKHAAALPSRPGRTSIVVLVTDAAVGNEGHVIKKARKQLGAERRLFVLGVGPAVDRRLCTRLARTCGGAADFLAANEDVEPAMTRFVRRVRAGGPVLTGLSTSFEGLAVDEVVPSALPDLYGGEALLLLGRYPDAGSGRLVITGATADGRPFRQEIDVDMPAADETPGLARLWARRKVDAFLERAERDSDYDARADVLALALVHEIVTPYTSLVAEDSEVVADGPPRRADVPVAEPGADLEAAAMAEDAFAVSESRSCGPAAFGGAVADGAVPGGAMPPVACAAPAPMRPPVGRVSRKEKRRHIASHDLLEAAEEPVRTRRAGLLRSVSGAVSRALSSGEQSQTLRLPKRSDRYDAEELRWLSSRASGELDLVFLVDETGSMGPYIGQVKQYLLQLVEAVRRSPLCKSLRIGLVSYRDHAPQDHTYASRSVALTDDISVVRSAVQSLRASGGGDGPESVTDGLFDVVRLGWRRRAAKAVVWFGDAPPHGVEPHGDGFPQGCPCGNHWFTQAESLREMGISVYAVGCLPGLTAYVGAEEVFKTVATTTHGTYLPLHQADVLVPLIAGAAETELDKQRLDARVREIIESHAELLERTDDRERVRWLTDVLRLRGVRPRTIRYAPDLSREVSLEFREVSAQDVAAAVDRIRAAS